jgi:phosphoribosylamine---glycine ligase
MRVLVVGNGGREHALRWKLEQDSRVNEILKLPAEISSLDVQAVVNFALENQVDFTVIGPDDPLAAGIVDAFLEAGLRVFGPTKAAAKLEWSKSFAKTMMRDLGVPTASFESFENLEPALEFVKSKPFSSPGFVIKADGLALGKGVIVCDDLPEAIVALERMFDGEFGSAGARVLVEERLSGPELSVFAFIDGTHIQLAPTARDHKRIFDGDRGPNTGGMGAYAPVPGVTKTMLDEILERVFKPVIHGMKERGTPYRGVLYLGLMLTPNGINVIEFNARFGDPEAQILMPLLETDLLDVLEACADGDLSELEIQWKNESCATVVLASSGYPGNYPKGIPIHGLENLPDGVIAFHAATKLEHDQTVTNGGRVLNITATGPNLELALERAYAGVSSVKFEGMQYRKDIGRSSVPDQMGSA